MTSSTARGFILGRVEHSGHNGVTDASPGQGIILRLAKELPWYDSIKIRGENSLVNTKYTISGGSHYTATAETCWYRDKFILC